MTGVIDDIVLSNVGPGPDSLALADLTVPVAPADPTTTDAVEPAHDALVLLLHRDHHAGQCRRQVRAVADRYDEFRERGCQIVSVVPEPRSRVQEWQDRYELPFPLCADPDTTVGDHFEQPIRFGTLGEQFDLAGRMPTAIVFDVPRVNELEVVATYRGRTTMDRPEIDALLATVEQRT